MVAVIILLTAALAGCQRTTSVGVYNACGFPVEADTNDVTPPSEYIWAEVDDGARRGLRQFGEVTTEYIMWVRTDEGGPVKEFTVRKEDLAAPPEGYDYDLEIVLEGDRCPGGRGQEAQPFPARPSSTR